MKNISALVIFNLFILFCMVNFSSSEIINCVSCKADEKNCTTNPRSEFMKTEKCDYHDQNTCYVKLDKDGRNERGCIKLDKCKEEEKCYMCIENKHKCNNQIVPKERPNCYQCNGRKCDDPEKRKVEGEYCEFYDSKLENDCFTTNKTFNVIRGCFAGAKKEDIDCDGQKDCVVLPCYKAAGPPPCNIEVIDINKCYKCDSKSDSNCAAEFTASEKYENCKTETGCYRRYKDGVAYRGCAENLTEEELKDCKKADNKNCQHCESPGCNTDKINGSGVIIISNLILISSILINSKFF